MSRLRIDKSGESDNFIVQSFWKEIFSGYDGLLQARASKHVVASCTQLGTGRSIVLLSGRDFTNVLKYK